MYFGGVGELMGKEVVVLSEGMIYRGTLIEISDTEVFLQSSMGWVQLQTERITEIKPA